MPVIKTKDATKVVLERVKALTKSEVLIGIPDAEAERYATLKAAKKARKQKKSGEAVTAQAVEGISNAGLGYVSEFGMPEKNIPARPFLVPGVTDAKDRVAKALASGAKKTLSGDPAAVEASLTRAGLIAERAVKSRIDEGPFVPLAPGTLAQRRRRGRTGEKPLIDTAQMQRSVTHVVRPKGET